MNILLVGSSGFIGLHLARALRAGNNVRPFDVRDGLDMTNFVDVAGAVDRCDVILHFGAAAVGARNMAKNVQAREAECVGVKHFAEAASRARIPLVFASSIRVYGTDAEMSGGETRNTHPVDPYGQMKLQAEEILLDYAEKSNLSFAIVRMAAAYGPGMPGDSVLSLFLRALEKGEGIELTSSGLESRNSIYVEDIALSVRKLLSRGFPSNEIFNIASSETISLCELSVLLGDIAGRPLRVEARNVPGEKRPNEQIPIIKARTFLGWEPAVSLKDGLRRTYAFLTHPH